MNEFVWDIPKKLKDSNIITQDYAILILNQPISVEPKLLHNLWSRAIIRAIADGGSTQWMRFLEKNSTLTFAPPDFISGDFDSMKPATKMFYESEKIPLIPTPDQDETDFSKALKIIEETSSKKNLDIKWVLAVCENSGRFDQIIANMNTILRSTVLISGLPVVILASNNMTWVLRAGKNYITVNREYIKDRFPCGIIPLCGPTKISTSGFRWNLDRQTSNLGDLVSTSNLFVRKRVEVVCDRDVLFTTVYRSTEL